MIHGDGDGVVVVGPAPAPLLLLLSTSLLYGRPCRSHEAGAADQRAKVFSALELEEAKFLPFFALPSRWRKECRMRRKGGGHRNSFLVRCCKPVLERSRLHCCDCICCDICMFFNYVSVAVLESGSVFVRKSRDLHAAVIYCKLIRQWVFFFYKKMLT